MAILINRAASGLAAASYLFVAAINGGIYPLISIAVFLLLPLACIWFPEEMGSLAYVRSLPAESDSSNAESGTLLFHRYLNCRGHNRQTIITLMGPFMWPL